MSSGNQQYGLRVIKVGGSLFDLEDLPHRLASVLADAEGPDMASLLIPGGGALADGVRRYDAVLRLPERVSHDVAVGSMHLMAQMLSAATGYPMVATQGEIADVHAAGAAAILDVRRLLADCEPNASGEPLLRNWSVTSDSIAARLSRVLAADELWLCKSKTACEKDSASQLVEAGLVDESFPRYAVGLRWRILDLRA